MGYFYQLEAHGLSSRKLLTTLKEYTVEGAFWFPQSSQVDGDDFIHAYFVKQNLQLYYMCVCVCVCFSWKVHENLSLAIKLRINIIKQRYSSG